MKTQSDDDVAEVKEALTSALVAKDLTEIKKSFAKLVDYGYDERNFVDFDLTKYAKHLFPVVRDVIDAARWAKNCGFENAVSLIEMLGPDEAPPEVLMWAGELGFQHNADELEDLVRAAEYFGRAGCPDKVWSALFQATKSPYHDYEHETIQRMLMLAARTAGQRVPDDYFKHPA